MPAAGNDILFEALTPIGLTVRVTRNRWLVIVSAKHPVMAGRELSVRNALERPDEVRESPRSYKNKTVGQRMLIISAGVIMNLIFGFLLFIVVLSVTRKLPNHRQNAPP